MRISKFWLPVALVAITAVSCSGGGGGGNAASSSSTSTTSSSSEAPSPQDVLKAVALTAKDVPANATLKLISGGDQVEGQVTLDLCGADFPSEELRTARLQQVARDTSNVTVVNNENVMYQSAQAADQAFTELRQAISSCDPTAFVHSHVSSVPDLRYELTTLPEADLAGLSQDHVAFTAKLTAQNGQTMTSVLIFQRRGAVLVGMYGPTVDQLMPFAQLAATRLAALTASEARE